MNMRFWVFFMLVVLIVSCVQKQPVEEVKDPWLTAGTVFTYGVDFQGTTYDFIVTLNSLDPDVDYSWEMTDPVNISGRWVIARTALDSAYIQNNYYFPGTDTLDSATSGWLSRKTFSELKNNGKTMIGYSGSSDMYELVMQSKEVMKVMLDDVSVDLNVIRAETENGFVYYILDNEKYPVILHMNVEFEIKIKMIKSKQIND